MLNYFIDLEPQIKNLNEETFLLAVSGQVPMDKLLQRLEVLKGIDFRNYYDHPDHKSFSEAVSPERQNSKFEDYLKIQDTLQLHQIPNLMDILINNSDSEDDEKDPLEMTSLSKSENSLTSNPEMSTQMEIKHTEHKHEMDK